MLSIQQSTPIGMNMLRSIHKVNQCSVFLQQSQCTRVGLFSLASRRFPRFPGTRYAYTQTHTHSESHCVHCRFKVPHTGIRTSRRSYSTCDEIILLYHLNSFVRYFVKFSVHRTNQLSVQFRRDFPKELVNVSPISIVRRAPSSRVPSIPANIPFKKVTLRRSEINLQGKMLCFNFKWHSLYYFYYCYYSVTVTHRGMKSNGFCCLNRHIIRISQYDHYFLSDTKHSIKVICKILTQ